MKDIKANLTIGNTPTVRGHLQIGGAVSGNTISNGTKDYEKLENKPSLQYGTTVKELVGTVSMADFGLKEEALQGLTNTDIDAMIRRIF